MTGAKIRVRGRMTRIAHHYFYPPGSTMVRFPLFLFSKRNPEARKRFAKVLWAERKAGRLRQWDMGTPARSPGDLITPTPLLSF